MKSKRATQGVRLEAIRDWTGKATTAAAGDIVWAMTCVAAGSVPSRFIDGHDIESATNIGDALRGDDRGQAAIAAFCEIERRESR
jgi:hypothetical protein